MYIYFYGNSSCKVEDQGDQAARRAEPWVQAGPLQVNLAKRFSLGGWVQEKPQAYICIYLFIYVYIYMYIYICIVGAVGFLIYILRLTLTTPSV